MTLGVDLRPPALSGQADALCPFLPQLKHVHILLSVLGAGREGAGGALWEDVEDLV